MPAQYRQPSGQNVSQPRRPKRHICPLRGQLYPRSSLSVLRRVLVRPAHELMQGEGDFVGMRRAPGNNALELDGIVGDGADFHQLGFNGLRVSHRISSMAHVGTIDTWL